MIVLENILITCLLYLFLYTLILNITYNAIIILWLSLALMNNYYIAPWANIICNIGHIFQIQAIDH